MSLKNKKVALLLNYSVSLGKKKSQYLMILSPLLKEINVTNILLMDKFISMVNGTKIIYAAIGVSMMIM